MDLEAVRRTLEPDASDASSPLPLRFYEALLVNGLRVAAVESGRVVCSFAVSPRLANPAGYLQSGVTAGLADVLGSAVFYTTGMKTTGVSLEISVSYVDAATVGRLARLVLACSILLFLQKSKNA